MNDDQVTSHPTQDALRALAEHDRSEQAPPFVEARVMAAFRAQHRSAWSPRPWWPWATLGAVAAAVIVAIAMRPAAVPEPQISSPLFTEQPPREFAMPEALPQPSIPMRRERPKSLATAPSASPVTPQEVVTEFFPLMDVMPPVDYGQVYRVTVPASTMRAVGIPVSRELWNRRVEAEVLVGEEGLARAIRFVGYEQ